MKQRRIAYTIVISAILFFPALFSLAAAEAEKWSGVDKSVVEKIAKEHGREAKSPLINTEQGDLLLFVFLIAGAVGGFAAGYYWKTLLVNKAGRSTQERKT
jgi:ABC-type cobalt transport system substrate-binding protein